MELTYWVSLDGSFLGGFSKNDPNIPIHSIQVPSAPPSGVGPAGNFTWDGDEWVPLTFGTVTDVQSGRFFVPFGEIYFINTFFQSIVKSSLDVEGDLHVDGQLFMEA